MTFLLVKHFIKRKTSHVQPVVNFKEITIFRHIKANERENVHRMFCKIKIYILQKYLYVLINRARIDFCCVTFSFMNEKVRSFTFTRARQMEESTIRLIERITYRSQMLKNMRKYATTENEKTLSIRTNLIFEKERKILVNSKDQIRHSRNCTMCYHENMHSLNTSRQSMQYNCV